MKNKNYTIELVEAIIMKHDNVTTVLKINNVGWTIAFCELGNAADFLKNNGIDISDLGLSKCPNCGQQDTLLDIKQ